MKCSYDVLLPLSAFFSLVIIGLLIGIYSTLVEAVFFDSSFWNSLLKSYEDLSFFSSRKDKRIYPLGKWSGTRDGCNCLGVDSVPATYRNKVRPGFCTTETAPCKNVYAINPVSIDHWKETAIFADSYKLSYLNFLERMDQNGSGCIVGHACGLLDNFNQVLCIDTKSKCPWNRIISSNQGKPPVDGFTYETIQTSSNSYLHGSSEEINKQVFTRLEASEGPILTVPDQKCQSATPYPLDVNKTVDCSSEEGKKLIDTSYKSIETMDKKHFFEKLVIWKKIEQLPGLPPDYLSTPVQLYAKNVDNGFNKTCLNAHSVNITNLYPNQMKKNVSLANAATNSTMLISALVFHCLGLVALMIVAYCCTKSLAVNKGVIWTVLTGGQVLYAIPFYYAVKMMKDSLSYINTADYGFNCGSQRINEEFNRIHAHYAQYLVKYQANMVLGYVGLGLCCSVGVGVLFGLVVYCWNRKAIGNRDSSIDELIKSCANGIVDDEMKRERERERQLQKEQEEKAIIKANPNKSNDAHYYPES